LRLPGELRNNIYSYALGGETVRVQCREGAEWTANCFYRIKEAALRLTCKQIRSEIGPYLAYSVNTFSGCDECLFCPINLAHQSGLQYISAIEMQPLDYKLGNNMIRRLKVMKGLRFLKQIVIIMPDLVTEEVMKDFLVKTKQAFEEGRETTQEVSLTIKGGVKGK
jgi:hypothetical protein